MFEIKVIDSLGGKINPSSNQTIEPGGNITFEFYPNFGMAIEDVFIDNEKVPNGNLMKSYTFSNVQSNHSIYIKYFNIKNASDNVAYNKYGTIRDIGYLVIGHLLKYNDDLWRILKYNDSEALQKDFLTLDEKRALIFDGRDNPDSEQYRIFRSAFLDDAITEQVSQLRVYLATINPENRSVGTVDVAIECVCHVKIQNLANYENRLEVMVQQVLQTLNGAEVEGVGKLVFDDNSSFFDLASLNKFNNRNFLGFTIVMSCKVGNIGNHDNYGGMFIEQI